MMTTSDKASKGEPRIRIELLEKQHPGQFQPHVALSVGCLFFSILTGIISVASLAGVLAGLIADKMPAVGLVMPFLIFNVISVGLFVAYLANSRPEQWHPLVVELRQRIPEMLQNDIWQADVNITEYQWAKERSLKSRLEGLRLIERGKFPERYHALLLSISEYVEISDDIPVDCA